MVESYPHLPFARHCHRNITHIKAFNLHANLISRGLLTVAILVGGIKRLGNLPKISQPVVQELRLGTRQCASRTCLPDLPDFVR